MQRQEETPLWTALCAHVESGFSSFHVPGHKGGAGAPPRLVSTWGRAVFSYDLTELPGLDNLHAPAGAIRAAQGLAAELYGARSTFFLVGGTSAGLVAALLASAEPGAKVLLPRHAHRSLLAACILGDFDPVFYPVRVDEEWGLPCGWDQAAAAAAVKENSEARALVLVHPTYQGLVGRTGELTASAHAAGLTVIADEAHGPHFYLHPDFPAGALRLGADIAVQSTHKLLGSLTQSSWLHLGTDRVAPDRVQEVLRWVESSSPSYLLMASLDLARREAAVSGRTAWGRILELAYRLRAGIGALPGIACLTASRLPEVVAHDPCKLVLSVASLGLTGEEAAAYLRREHGIQVELADLSTLLFVLTPADGEEKGEKLLKALAALARERRGARPLKLRLPSLPLPVRRLRPRAAAFAHQVKIPWSAARGRVAAQAIVPYPPGVPLVWPGEEIGTEVLEAADALRRAGLTLEGLQPGEKDEPLVAVVEE